MMVRRQDNRVHVYNFGFFYLPSYQEEWQQGSRQMGFEDGTLNVWEGDIAYDETPEHPSNNWPIV
jgi:hypothetical protein